MTYMAETTDTTNTQRLTMETPKMMIVRTIMTVGQKRSQNLM